MKPRRRRIFYKVILIALDHLDEVISLIRSSATPDIAKDNLIKAGWGLG
jgi:DNA gyrase subunit A